ncbi:MAG: hypothetical protein JO293_04075 [Candidatus Eremiobacteraeota bacterium]|nr:hypothetical protein [Candidatus Eremiobacteraeota bacterium]
MYFLANIFYGVTDRRVISVTGTGVTSFPFEQIESVSVNTTKDGSGLVTLIVRNRRRPKKIYFSLDRDAQLVHDLVESRLAAR